MGRGCRTGGISHAGCRVVGWGVCCASDACCGADDWSCRAEHQMAVRAIGRPAGPVRAEMRIAFVGMSPTKAIPFQTLRNARPELPLRAGGPDASESRGCGDGSRVGARTNPPIPVERSFPFAPTVCRSCFGPPVSIPSASVHSAFAALRARPAGPGPTAVRSLLPLRFSGWHRCLRGRAAGFDASFRPQKVVCAGRSVAKRKSRLASGGTSSRTRGSDVTCS